MSVQRDFFIEAGYGATSYPNFPFLQRYYLTGAGGNRSPRTSLLALRGNRCLRISEKSERSEVKIVFPLGPPF